MQRRRWKKHFTFNCLWYKKHYKRYFFYNFIFYTLQNPSYHLQLLLSLLHLSPNASPISCALIYIFLPCSLLVMMAFWACFMNPLLNILPEHDNFSLDVFLYSKIFFQDTEELLQVVCTWTGFAVSWRVA